MTFPEFLHILTTSRYTRKLEEENAELKAKLAQFELYVSSRMRAVKVAAEDLPQEIHLPEGIQRAVAQRGRPGRFQSFGAAKRELESQDPPQRSVNV